MINKLNEMNIVAKNVSGTLKNGELVKWNIKGVQSMENGLERVATLTTTIGKNGVTTSEKFSQSFDKIADAAQKIQSKLKDTGFDGFEQEIQRVKTAVESLDDSYDDLNASVKQLDAAMEAVNLAEQANDSKKLVAANKEYEDSLKQVYSQLKLHQQAEKLKIDKANLSSDMENWLSSNTKATRLFGAEIKKLQSSLDGLDADGVKRVAQQFNFLKKQAKSFGKTGLNVFDQLKTKIKEYSVYFSAAEMFMYVEQALRSMFDQVVAIDSAMTELKKVTNETNASYNKFLTDASSRASEIGTTIDGLISSTADFARLGYDFESSQGLAEVANIYAVVGDEIDSVETATKSLISTFAAFKNEAAGMSDSDFAMDIIDKFNEVSNNFAISSGGIGEALQRSASSLYAANNSLDESIALITAANTVVQDPDVVGTALKTVSMRVRGAKTEMEEAGLETEGMAESTAKLRAELLALSGVDIMLDKNTFKSTYQIMEEIAAKWENLTDIQQASVTELIAGKRQGNIIASLMTNFDVAQDALETSLNSSGSAMAEHEKWLQSLEAKLLQLKAAWQGLAQAFMSSDFLKGALDTLIAFVETLTKLIDTIGVIPTLLAGAGLFGLGKKGLGALFGTSMSKKDMLAGIAEAVGAIGENAGKSAGLLGKAKDALGGMASAGGSASGALTGVGSSLLSLAGAHPVIAGVTIVVAALTAAFMVQKKQAEELAKEVEETVASYKDQHNALMELKDDFDTSNEASLASRYKELSKGVDGLGKNVSLTADEYAEYQSVCNSIAESVPSLVSGYDEQGNAILNCKGNVEELTAAYEKLIHAQNQEILSSNARKIEEDWKNTLSQANGYDFFETIGNSLTLDGFLGGSTDDFDMKTDTAEWLSGLTSDTSLKEIKKHLGAFNQLEHNEIVQALNDAGYDVSRWSSTNKVAETLQNALKDEPQKIKGILDDYYAGFEEAVSEYKTKANALLSEAFDVDSSISGLNYSGIGEELQNIAYQTVNSLDFDFLSNLSEQGIDIEDWVTGMLDDLNALSRSAEFTEIEAAFNLKTKFNDGDISFGGYVGQIREVEELINSLDVDEEVKSQIKLALDAEGVIEQYDTLKKRLTSEEYDIQLNTKEAETFLDGLTSKELSVLANIIPELSDNDINETVEDLKEAIEKELALEPVTISIEVETEKLELLNAAISESLSGSGLTPTSLSSIESMFSGLSSYDPSKLFERTANGIRLNTTELSRLNTEQKNTNLASLNDKLSTLGDTYNETREELYGLTYGTDEYNAKAAELGSIEALINETETLISQYEGLTSAYQEWQMAEAAGNQRDMYENVISGFETVKDELSRGWADDGTIEFLELVTGRTDLAGKSGGELKKVYDGLGESIKYLNEEGKVLEDTGYSVRDFFTVDDEGNSTSKGVYNFLDAVGKLEEEAFGGKDVVQRDDNGNVIGFDFKTVGGDEVIAEALGISEELVQIMVRAADDAGFVVSMDGTYQQLDVLKEKAQEASVTLNDILEKNGKKGFDFNFNSTDIDDITKQLKGAKDILSSFRNEDGTINMGLEGAEEALTVTSTLQSMLDNLTRPAYMDIQTSQVEDELKKPLEELQELQRLTETEHQLEISGADTSDLKASKEEIYEYFEGLDPEIKAQMNLVDDKGNPLSGQALRDKIDSGEIEIPATVDIQLEMDEKLGILVDKALLDAGIIDDKEFEKRVDVYLDADVDNKDAKEKTDKAVKEVAGDKNSKSDSKDSKSSGDKVEKNVDVEVKANKVDTSDVNKKTDDAVNGEVPTGADGRKMGMGVDVEVKAEEVDTSDVKNKTEDAIKDESGKTSTIEKEVDLEVTVEEYRSLIQDLENADKDIVIDVTVKGLDDVKELNKNIDIAANVNGDIDNLNEYVEAAKALSKLDDNVTSYVMAEIDGNVIDTPEYAINNLKVFSDSAKDIKNIGTSTSKITADVEGNVIDLFEEQIDNLKTFSDSAKEVGSIGEVESKVTANIDGDVAWHTEEQLDNLKVFAESAKEVGSIGEVESSVTASVHGNVTRKKEIAIDNLAVFAESAKGVDSVGEVKSSVTADVHGNVTRKKEIAIDNLSVFATEAKKLKDEGIGTDTKASITANVYGNVINEKERAIDNLSVFAEEAKALKDEGIGTDTAASITANVYGNVISEKEKAIDNLSVFAEEAKKLKDENIGTDTKASITANVYGNVINNEEKAIDNLSVFAEEAQKLKSENIGTDTKASITANVYGNVINNKEKAIDNLSVFAEEAKKLKDESIGTDTVASITANVYGNVVNKAERAIDNLSKFAEEAESLKSAGIGTDTKASITANVYGNVINEKEKAIDNLSKFAEEAKALKGSGIGTDTKASVTADIYGNVIGKKETTIDNLSKFAEEAKALDGVGNVSSTVTANLNGTAAFVSSGQIDNLNKFTENAKALNGVGDISSSVTADISGNFTDNSVSRLEHFKSVISGMSANQTATINVTANVDSANIEKAISILSDASNSGVFKNYNATVSVGAKVATVDDSVVQAYIATTKEANGKVKWSNDTALVDAFKSTTHTASGVVKWDDDSTKLKLSGWTATGKVIWDDSPAAGTAHSSGSAFAGGTSGRAFARGDWSIGHDGIALGGELGRRYCDHT